MQTRPVFRNRFEIKVWKRLDKARTAEDLIKISGKVTGRRGGLSSAVLVRLIEEVFDKCGPSSVPLMERIASKSLPGNCAPILTVASVCADIGDTEKAAAISESVGDGNIPLSSCVRAKVHLANGDTVKAKKELMRARCSDPTCRGFYDLIRKTEPSEGWMQRLNIELLVSGEELVPLDETAVPEKVSRLYGIYHNWYRGSRDAATREMIHSGEYAAKDSEYVLASARMSVDERDWHSARMMYDLLMSKSSNCVYILTEAANAYHRGGNLHRASELYSDALSLDPRASDAMAGLMRVRMSFGMKKEAFSLMGEYLASEDASFESYSECADILTDASMCEEAADILGALHTSYPDDSTVFTKISANEFLRGDMNAAMNAATDAVRRDRKSVSARSQRAKVLMKIGKIKKASSELRKARRIDPKNIAVMLLMKDIAVRKGDYAGAAKICGSILDIDPGNIEATDTLSGVRSRDGSKNNPYSFYRDAVLADYRPENFINIISSMVRDGMYREAAGLCYEHDREFGKSVTVMKLRGNAEYALKEYDKASRSFASAAAADPRDPVTWHSKGMADEAGGDLDSAEEAFNKAVLMNLDESEFWISRASVQDKKGDPKGAVESLNRAIELKPDSAYALVRKGVIFANSSNFEEALYFIDMALTIDPDNTEAYRVQRDICLASGSYDRAVKVCEEMIRRDPTDADSVSGAVKAYIGIGDTGRASDLLNRSLQKNPDSVPLLIIKKDFCASSGDVRGVTEACEHILRLQPDNRAIISEMADTKGSSGKVTADRVYFAMRQDTPDPADENRADVPRGQGETGAGRYVPDRVKRQAERVLRRAYTSRSATDDPDLTDSLDIDRYAADEIRGYLSDMPEYGVIVPGTSSFERMEKLSVNAVVKGRRTDLETDPSIPVECAYVAGGAKDADEAKLLVSYIHKVMTSDIGDDPGGLPESRVPNGSAVYDVMKRYGVGVYRARAMLRR